MMATTTYVPYNQKVMVVSCPNNKRWPPSNTYQPTYWASDGYMLYAGVYAGTTYMAGSEDYIGVSATKPLRDFIPSDAVITGYVVEITPRGGARMGQAVNFRVTGSGAAYGATGYTGFNNFNSCYTTGSYTLAAGQKLTINLPYSSAGGLNTDGIRGFCLAFAVSQCTGGGNVTNFTQFECASIYYRIGIVWDYAQPAAPVSLAPANQTANPRRDIRLSWDSSGQVNYSLRYKLDAGSWTTVSGDSTKYYILPADSFTASSGTVTWQVRIKDSHGLWSAWATAAFTLAVLAQAPPVLLSPVDEYIDSDAINFAWLFIPSTTETLAQTEIKYQLGALPEQTLTVSGDSQQVTASIGNPGSGLGKWRARVTNNFGDVSDWAPWATFSLVGHPSIPQITSISAVNLPLVSWYSQDQETYLLTIKQAGRQVYTSGSVIGPEIRSHQVTQPLPPGSYAAELVIYNSYGISSPTAIYSFVVPTGATNPPDMLVSVSDAYVRISGSPLDCEILRDGQKIGVLTDGEFKDYTGGNRQNYQYQLRNWSGGAYADSAAVSARVNFRGSLLAPAANPGDYIVLMYGLEEHPFRSFNLELDIVSIPLNGRKYAAKEYSGQAASTVQLGFFVWDYRPLAELINSKQELIYRDNRGEIYYGYISGLAVKQNLHGYEVTCTLERSRNNA